MMFDTERASVPASIAESLQERDPARATASGSSGHSLSNAETLELFSQLLDTKFDQKFAAFKRDLDEKEAATQSQLKKLKTETKASSSFNFKGNKVEEYESDELADDSEDEKKLRSAERRALVKIREKKRKHASNRSNSTATHPNPSEGSSTGLSTGGSFSPIQPFFRMQSFRGRQPQPADKCFSCGQRGHWANFSVYPSRFRGSVSAVPNSKNAS